MSFGGGNRLSAAQRRPYREDLQELYNEARDLEEASPNVRPPTPPSAPDRPSNRPGRNGPLSESKKVKQRFVRRFGSCADCRERAVECRWDHFPPEYEQRYQDERRNRLQQIPHHGLLRQGSGSGQEVPTATGTSGRGRPTGGLRTEPSVYTGLSSASMVPSTSSRDFRMRRQTSGQGAAPMMRSLSISWQQPLRDVGSQFSDTYQGQYNLGDDPVLVTRNPMPVPFNAIERKSTGSANPTSSTYHASRVTSETPLLYGRRQCYPPMSWECLYSDGRPVVTPDGQVAGELTCPDLVRSSASDLWHHYHSDHNGVDVDREPEGHQIMYFCKRCLAYIPYEHWACDCPYLDLAIREERLYSDINARGYFPSSLEMAPPSDLRGQWGG